MLVEPTVDEAAKNDGVFHMWLHPNDLTHERDDHRMRAILASLDRRRTETDLTVETMADVAYRITDVSTDVTERPTVSRR